MMHSYLGTALRVTPSALDEAGRLALSIASAVRSLDGALPGVASASFVGDGMCADALVKAALLVEQTLGVSADGVQALATALEQASGTYQLADVEAVAAAPGGRQ